MDAKLEKKIAKLTAKVEKAEARVIGARMHVQSATREAAMIKAAGKLKDATAALVVAVDELVETLTPVEVEQ